MFLKQTLLPFVAIICTFGSISAEDSEEAEDKAQAVYFCYEGPYSTTSDLDYCLSFRKCLLSCEISLCPFLRDMTYDRIVKSKEKFDLCTQEILSNRYWPWMTTTTTQTTAQTTTQTAATGKVTPPAITTESTTTSVPLLEGEDGFLYFCTQNGRNLLENPDNCHRVIKCVRHCYQSNTCPNLTLVDFELLFKNAKALLETCMEKHLRTAEWSLTTTSDDQRPTPTTTTTPPLSPVTVSKKTEKLVYLCTQRKGELSKSSENCQRLKKCLKSCRIHKKCLSARHVDPKRLKQSLELYDTCVSNILPTTATPTTITTIRPTAPLTTRLQRLSATAITEPQNNNGKVRAERICKLRIIVRTENTTYCDKYYQCYKTGVKLKSCPKGEVFDDLRFKCAPSATVQCNGRKRP